jgi:hypothetical protein
MEHQSRYIYMPTRGSVRVEGFPAAILSYRAEEVSHIVPGHYERNLVDWARENELLEFLGSLGYRTVPINGYSDILLAESR